MFHYSSGNVMVGALLLAAASVAAALPAKANLLINGDFEQNPGGQGDSNHNSFPGMPGQSGDASWDTWSSMPGWQAPTGQAIEIQTQNTLNPSLGPHGGNYYAELDAHPQARANSSMVQTFTGGSAAGFQTLSYHYRPRTTSPDDNGIRVYFNNTLIGALEGDGAQLANWVQLSALVTVLADLNTVRFEAFGTANTFGGLIDDVHLTPLPAAAWLFGSAFLGLCWLGRRSAMGPVGTLPQ